ncbi:hypothetical protein [Cellulomonas sp. URHE0023]|uniref:hypothetical protein n=1 Tax=Cellulomonas sp. URHE0023 TaxID=1380354 RepID=UPI0004841953|nr:hypothetical protein [Cellulomonas sp. URHE0023]
MAEGLATGHGLARAIWASSLCACSVVLLVAGKTTAGLAFAGMALILVSPLRRLVANERRRVWVRALAIAALLAVAAVGIAGTDIRPDQHRTGVVPVDKVAAIVEDFVDVVTGRSGTPAQGTITQEMAEEFVGCLREAGLADVPDPVVSEDGMSVDYSRTSATQDAIDTASAACRHILEDDEDG